MHKINVCADVVATIRFLPLFLFKALSNYRITHSLAWSILHLSTAAPRHLTCYHRILYLATVRFLSLRNYSGTTITSRSSQHCW